MRYAKPSDYSGFGATIGSPCIILSISSGLIVDLGRDDVSITRFSLLPQPTNNKNKKTIASGLAIAQDSPYEVSDEEIDMATESRKAERFRNGISKRALNPFTHDFFTAASSERPPKAIGAG